MSAERDRKERAGTPDAFSSRNVTRALSLASAVGGLCLGLVGRFLGFEQFAYWSWVAGTIPVLVVLTTEIVSSLRRGEVGLDLVAAISMAGALILGEPLAGIVVGVMYAGGQFMEVAAEGRARRTMTALLERTPREATRYEANGLARVALDAVRPGDRLLIRKGDVLPVDGVVRRVDASLDESTLTGEPGPIRRPQGTEVMSGSANVGDAFDLDAARSAAESTYAGIVRLVEEAQSQRAPMVRMADRYAVVLLVVTTALAAAAWWVSGDPVRALAVFVVATPCPLILAVPIALISGTSRAAQRGVLVKGSRALEALAGIRVAVFDKTGTLTPGRPSLRHVETVGCFAESDILQLAASLEQGSSHSVAAAIVEGAKQRNLSLAVPTSVREAAGEGIEGIVDGRHIAVGSRSFIASHTDLRNLPERSVSRRTAVIAIDGKAAGSLDVDDAPRREVRDTLSTMRRQGIDRIVLATGDDPGAASVFATGFGLDAIYAGLSPAEKVGIIRSERLHGPTMMIGDGTNDAPALAAADLGIAMGAGAAASAQTADIILLTDNLSRIPEAIAIARRSRRIALQSVLAGLSLSGIGMLIAAAGYLPPVAGALAQEAIDVAVILNAMRALSVQRRSARN